MATDSVVHARGRLAAACLSLATLAWAAACLDGTGPRPPIEYGLTVSDTAAPISPAASGAGLSPSTASETDVVYVSLPPGATPDGELATIRNLRTGSIVIVAVVAGGFDPVALDAAVDDTIEVVVRDASRALVFQVQAMVAMRRPPIVVRTDPPPRKRDVPLNTSIVIVFTEPIAAASVSTASIRLLHGDTPVAGRVELAGDGLRAEFVPEGLLAPNTDYALEINTTVADLDGDALQSPARADFRTGASVPQPVALIITPNPLLSVPADAGPWGYAVPLRAAVLDAAGNELPYTGLLQWRSSDSTVVSWGADPGSGQYVGSSEIDVYVRAAGSATITATAGGLTGTATVRIEDVAFDGVSVGVNYLACYLTVGGAAYCSGNNYYGQLGIGAAFGWANSPVGVAGGFLFEAISSGWDHTCGLTLNGEAYCWGENGYGQLGDGTAATVRASPVRVASGGLAFTQIGSGWSHTCALTAAGKAYCWGAYGWALVVSGTTDPAAQLGPVPVPVPGNLTFTRLGVGGAHTCGLDAGGAAYCWGMNGGGQLGDGSVTRSYSPVAVTGGHTFVAIDGGMVHTCGVTTAGEVYCWGGGGAGTSESGTVTVPTRIELPAGVALVEIAAGGNLTCGLTQDGAAYCWGWTFQDGLGPEVFLPPQRMGDVTFKAVDAGNNRACGVTTSADVQCWWPGDLAP